MDAREMGRKGGRARARGMTAEQRRQSAIVASEAAAKARKAKAEAKARARKDGNPNSRYICEILIEKPRKDGGGK